MLIKIIVLLFLIHGKNVFINPMNVNLLVKNNYFNSICKFAGQLFSQSSYNQKNKNIIQDNQTNIDKIIFINSKSGGMVGRHLMHKLSEVLDPKLSALCDLNIETPHTKLSSVFSKNFHIVNNSKINVLCCGGDGTILWIMDEAYKLNFSSKINYGIIPLGTGNDLFNHIISSNSYYNKDEKSQLQSMFLNSRKLLSSINLVLHMIGNKNINGTSNYFEYSKFENTNIINKSENSLLLFDRWKISISSALLTKTILKNNKVNNNHINEVMKLKIIKNKNLYYKRDRKSVV
jgi:hypothetical protein